MGEQRWRKDYDSTYIKYKALFGVVWFAFSLPIAPYIDSFF